MKQGTDTHKTKKAWMLYFLLIPLLVSLFFAYNYFVVKQSLKKVSLKNGSFLNKRDIKISMPYSGFLHLFYFNLDGKDISSHAIYKKGKVILQLKGLREGPHKIFIGIKGKYNPYTLISFGEKINYTVDTTAPFIEIEAPSSNIIKDIETYIQGKTEPYSTVSIKVYGNTYTVHSNAEGVFYKKILIDKEVTDVYITSTDKAGNSSSLMKELILDKTPPKITINSPKPHQIIKDRNHPIVLQATIEDTGSGIRDCYFEINGKKEDGIYDAQRKTLTLEVKDIDEGLCEAKVIAIDRAGWKREKRWAFTLDTTEIPGKYAIRTGARGKDVEIIQKLLIKRGFLEKGHITGIYDSETAKAIMAVQARRGYPQTGVTDKKTFYAISNKIYIYLDEFALFLISPDDKVLKKYPIATGSPYHPTPTGSFYVKEKVYYPAWYPPNSPWARGAKPIPPGPGNPLGTRWIGLSGDVVGIHGTPSAWTIGRAASHGCIRMYIPQVEELFEMVTVGTPVNIYASRPPSHKKYRLKKKKKERKLGG